MMAVNLVTEEGVTPHNTDKKPLQSLQIVELPLQKLVAQCNVLLNFSRNATPRRRNNVTPAFPTAKLLACKLRVCFHEASLLFGVNLAVIAPSLHK